MAKRSRGSVRPGQRRPASRRPASAAAAPRANAGTVETPRPNTLTEAEEARAAELEASILAEERAAATVAHARRDRARQASDRARTGGRLAEEEAIEYRYVERDIRRIVATAVFLLGVLIALWLILEVAGLAPV